MFRVVVAAWLVGTLCVDSTDPFAIIATFNNIYDRSRHALPRCWGSRFGMGFGGSAATVPNRTAYPRTGSTIDLRRPYVAPDPDAVRTAAWNRGRSRSSHVTRAGPFAFHRDTGWAVSRPRGLINYIMNCQSVTSFSLQSVRSVCELFRTRRSINELCTTSVLKLTLSRHRTGTTSYSR